VNSHMMAAVLYGKENLQVEPVAVPTIGSGDILVRVKVALTCGTDVKVYRRGYHARMIVPPALFGHELAGVVEHVGAGVKGFRKGMRVVALNSAPCGRCFYCSKHQENLCEDLLFNNGAYAEYIRIPKRIVQKNMLTIPDYISYHDAAMVEPLACVLRGLHETGVEIGDTVTVIGGGPIGLMFVQVAHAIGCNVIAVVKRDSQVAAAKRKGANEVVQITRVGDPVQAVRAISPCGRGPDVVIEAVGRPEAWEWAVGMVRKGGTVNFFGGCASGTKVQLDTNRLHYSEITLKATFHHTPETVRRAFDLIAERKVKGADYITGEAPLSRLHHVLRDLSDRNGEIKTAIIPGH
jgi:L-iditol 2-dehydrogenase